MSEKYGKDNPKPLTKVGFKTTVVLHPVGGAGTGNAGNEPASEVEVVRRNTKAAYVLHLHYDDTNRPMHVTAYHSDRPTGMVAIPIENIAYIEAMWKEEPYSRIKPVVWGAQDVVKIDGSAKTPQVAAAAR